MKSLLNALQEGRLVELPENDKEKVLEYLALLIEAIPDIGSTQDLVAEVGKREATANTALGLGVACPHVRSKQEGELLCAVGWSPEGIEYGASDGKKVHLVVMYYIPDSQRNSYLKEISGLAKAIRETESVESFSAITDIQSIRNRLLDWVEFAVGKAVPDAKARMIKLEEKHAAALSTLAAGEGEIARAKLSVIPFTIVTLEGEKSIVLSKHGEIVEVLERSAEAAQLFSADAAFEFENYFISVMSHLQYSKSRSAYECVAIKMR